MNGTLHGWRVRIVGRVVMGMEIDGETYYWNEFNLVDETGHGGTLVHEETEDGVEWKLFTLFEPQNPMTAGQARRQRVGHRVDLDGQSTPVTLVDQSRVHHIEGTAPEGVQVGDVADYFNADAGDRMLVASWTGDEIEFYEGRDLRPEEVAQAFGISASSRGPVTGSLRPPDETRERSRRMTWFVLIALGAAVVIGLFACIGGARKRTASAPPPKQPAPALQLPTGGTGVLGAGRFTIENQAIVEVARVGRRHDRREYLLVGSRNERALLINALNGGTKEWHLFTPASAEGPISSVPAYEAAAKRKGAPVVIGTRTLHVSELFLTRSRGANIAEPWAPLQYGFVARAGSEWVLARWTDTTLQFHDGRQLSESEVLAAFKTKL